MKSFFRFLFRNRLYTVIEVAGMAVAIAFVLFIGTFLIGEYTSDSAIKRQGDIYVGASESMYLGSATVKEQLEGRFPEIEGICRAVWTYILRGVPMEMTAGEMVEPFSQDALVVDKNFFTMFPIQLDEGNAAGVLEQKDAAVLSESFASIAFPGRSPLGETVKVSVDGTERMLTVTGIFKDFKNSILHQPQIIYRTDVLDEIYPGLLRNGNGTATVFYKVSENADMASLNDRIAEVVRENDYLYIAGLFKDYRLVPFSEVGTSAMEVTVPFENVVPVEFVHLFLAAGILLLVFAVLNYVSLTVAQTGFRAREMASRRLVGAQRSSIIIRYVFESFILTCTSFVLSLLLTALFSPAVSALIGKDVDPLSGLGLAETVFMAGLVILLSLCSGIVPAIAVSGYRPIDIVRGSFSGKTKMTFGKILITCQSVIAIATLALSGIMFLQIRHMISRPMGYDTEGLVMIAGAQRPSHYRIDELRSVPGVEEIGWLQTNPMSAGITGARIPIGGREVRIDLFYCDSVAFNILGFETLKSCCGHVEGGLWVPESSLAGLGADYASMEISHDNGMIPLCGIIREFRKGGADSDNADNGYIACPMIVNMDSDDDFQVLRELVVKVSSDVDEAAERLTEFYGKYNRDIVVNTYDAQLRGIYNTEDRNLKLIGIFTLLAVLLTSLAMLAMSTYFVKQRSKEAAVKKVMGCGRGRLFFESSFTFLATVAVAAVISTPMAWVVAGRWLEDYSYRIDNVMWVYLAAAVGMVAVAVISVSWQTIRLINTDPVMSLKEE